MSFISLIKYLEENVASGFCVVAVNFGDAKFYWS